MLGGLRYALEVLRLEKQKRAIRADYKQKLEGPKRLERSSSFSIVCSLKERMKLQNIDAELLQLLSFRLLELAQRNLLPHPKFDSQSSSWTQSSPAGQWHLTIDEIARLRSAIRQERKEKFDNWRLWLASFTGLIGALIGLVSLFFKK